MGVIVRVFEAFSGVGAQRMSLRNLGIEHEVVGISEIDKFAIKSYEAIHGETVNFGDISKLNPKDLPDFDLFTYSFPCQDLSIAGQQAGMVKGQTRSGLLYECEKIIEAKLPKYLLLENVKNLVGKKFKPQFDEWLSYLEGLGYTNYWQVLNAKDYGVPQNRERVFVVSILGDHSTYVFPTPIPLTRVVKDILEDEVEERFYINLPLRLSPDYLEQAQPAVLRQERTDYGKAIRKQYEAGLIQEKRSNMREFKPRPDGLSNTLTTVQKDNYVMEWVVQEAKRLAQQTRKEPIEVTVKPNKDLRPHRLDPKKSGLSELNITYDENCAHVVTTTHAPKIYGVSTDYRIRKMTPLECWRLMGFSDDDFNKAKSAGLSNSQLYKQAGNSIVVPVLEGIFSELFK